MEWTVSNATILGTETEALASSCSRCWGSLWRNTCFGTPLLRMPWIIDAWFPASENIWHSSRAHTHDTTVLLLAKQRHSNKSRFVCFGYSHTTCYQHLWIYDCMCTVLYKFNCYYNRPFSRFYSHLQRGESAYSMLSFLFCFVAVVTVDVLLVPVLVLLLLIFFLLLFFFFFFFCVVILRINSSHVVIDAASFLCVCKQILFYYIIFLYPR